MKSWQDGINDFYKLKRDYESTISKEVKKLDKQIIQSGGKKLRIMFSGKPEDFDPKFKVYLLCKLISPHFSPELAAKSTIIDFNVTIIGLEQQLQGAVISKEQKHLEEQ